MNNNCINCKYLYKSSDTGYWTHWCLFFKVWLVPDSQHVPLRCNSCNELEGKDEK
jgi:hypothetical protein